MDVLKEAIKSFMEVDQVSPPINGATVSCVKGKPRYVYSPELTEREKLVKEDQKNEVQTGVAEAVYGEPYLIVSFKK